MELADYIRTPGGLYLLFQLERGPKSLGYLAEKATVSRDELRQRLREAKEIGLIGERRDDGEGITYELDPKGEHIVQVLKDSDGFDRKRYIDKRREINETRQQLQELENEMESIVAEAGEIVTEFSDLEEDEDEVRLTFETE
ncbi:MAG: hypothetical protein SV186_03515 [Candidatus Nanohaloarchaea archaeon]|nr:hypothetical protein [Candidatus Nanohaloarchaea archaeon]